MCTVVITYDPPPAAVMKDLLRGSESRYMNMTVLGEGTFAVVWKVFYYFIV